jgi:hypothetical protein
LLGFPTRRPAFRKENARPCNSIENLDRSRMPFEPVMLGHASALQSRPIRMSPAGFTKAKLISVLAIFEQDNSA